METIEQTLNGSPADGQTSTVTISRNGDLVYKVYVTSTKSAVINGSNNIVDEVELEIGGQRIDKHYKEWMQTWNELSTPESKAIGLKAMQGDIGSSNTDGVKNLVQIPLQFWFCRNPGLALPLIALQYHEVKLKIKWGSDFEKTSVNCDYIYLDTDERRRFAQVSHEYLIEQLQRETYTNGAGDKKLNLNHPVKELVWVNTSSVAGGIKYQLKLNGHDRFAEQEKEYFTLRQPIDYHTAVPRQNLPLAARRGNFVSTATDSLLSTAELGNGDGHATSVALGFDGTNDVTAPGATNVKWGVTNTASGALDPSTIVTNDVPSVVNVSKTGFLFASNSLPESHFTFNRMYKITAYGTAWVTGGTDLATATSAFARVTQINIGLGLPWPPAGKIFSTTTVVYFERQLVKAAAATDNLVITAIQEITPDSALVTEARTSKMTHNVNVYSFALKPEEHQPSGTCNFSRIDNAQLKVTGSDGGGNIYAVNYNVLRIMSGMGGLAYSN
jgi:hypothetical protein